jgi:hypothetical protein
VEEVAASGTSGTLPSDSEVDDDDDGDVVGVAVGDASGSSLGLGADVVDALGFWLAVCVGVALAVGEAASPASANVGGT